VDRVRPAHPVGSAHPVGPADPAAGPAGPDVPPEDRPQPDRGPLPEERGKAAESSIRPGSLDYDPDHEQDEDGGDCPDGPAGDPRPPAPVPALVNLVVHAGTLFGWDSTPTEAGGWGLLDADETRALVAAASLHPATRWCLTLLGLDGTAVAHGCSPGQHPWAPAREHDKPPGRRPPAPAEAASLAAFLRGLKVVQEPIATGNCDHAAAEPRYTPSRRLAHLVRARTATCDAPGCNAQAIHADLDHTEPYPQGPTCQCNLGPRCRRHHKAKQAPDWNVEQPEPGVIRWTLPSGRTHVTGPASYLLKR
jgi:hypothetical protein